MLVAACTFDRSPFESPPVVASEPASQPEVGDRPSSAMDERSATSASASAEPDPAWALEWRELASAAQREGGLSLLTWVGRGYRRTIEAFQRAFPGVQVEHVEESSADVWLERVRRERRVGTYAFDLGFLHTDRALKDGAPEGMWAPLKPLLFHPDVLNEAAWRDGLAERFVDAAGELCFGWSYSVFHCYAINTDLVAEGEITSVRDLLDPRWRGRILTGDPRLGTGLLSAASVARAWGSSILKPLLVDQRPVIVNGGPASVAEPLARGRYPIALGVRPKALDPLRERGIGFRVRYLDLPDADFVPTGSLLYFDRAPHPAAARLFANWVLTREGQAILAGSLQTNSARTDLGPFQIDETGRPNGAYYEPDRETNLAHTAATEALVRALLAGRG
jgi:iron(III) transport system substrate-binding protein